MHMNWSIECRGAEGAPASEACQSAEQYQAAVAQLLRQHVEPGHVLEDEHGQVVVRDRNGARVATYWFVEQAQWQDPPRCPAR